MPFFSIVGMGTDGTLGLRTIKEQAGVVLVQDPASAKFDAMPRSAIDASLADIFAPAEQLPARLLEYLQHAPLLTPADVPIEEIAQSHLEKAVIPLRSHTGHDCLLYKRNTLYRWIERRMGLHQIPRIGDYVRYLRENAQEVGLLFKELLIGVTSFFRDPAAWDQLRDELLPTLVSVERRIGSRDGRWFAMRLMPYRTMDNRIDGMVITITHMTVVAKLEAEVRSKLEYNERRQAQ